MSEYLYDEDKLRKLGIAFETSSETRAFIEFVQDELDFRVGKAVARHASSKELTEFDSCQTEAERLEIIKKICPDYINVTRRTRQSYEEELIEYRDCISGNIMSEKKPI